MLALLPLAALRLRSLAVLILIAFSCMAMASDLKGELAYSERLDLLGGILEVSGELHKSGMLSN